MNFMINYNYYPFGMLMPDMSWQSSGYRYGYNGMEMDNDVKGTGNHSSFGDYGYDPRNVRRYMLEPMIAKYPSLSPYVAYADNPILFKDPEGQNIFLFGDEQSKLVDILKSKTALNVEVINRDGYIELVFGGIPQSTTDEFLLQMSNDCNTHATLITTDLEMFTSKTEETNIGITVGGTDGKMNFPGIGWITLQYINLEHSNILQDAGLSTNFSDVFHELSESYIIGKYYPKFIDNKMIKINGVDFLPHYDGEILDGIGITGWQFAHQFVLTIDLEVTEIETRVVKNDDDTYDLIIDAYDKNNNFIGSKKLRNSNESEYKIYQKRKNKTGNENESNKEEE